MNVGAQPTERLLPVGGADGREALGRQDQSQGLARGRVVLDNLSTHSAGSLYETFSAPQAHRILDKIEFHFTPKHASWLNMVEIEIGVLRTQCLDRRIDNRDRLVSEIAAWERQRNRARASINWMFSLEGARNKLAKRYPKPTKES